MGQSELAPGRGRERAAWADVAKGLCIALVVLHHVVGKHYGVVVPEAWGGAEVAWQWVSETLKPVRMPLFFVLSGFFAAGALRRPWSQVVGPRVLSPYYLYVMWLGIQGVVFTVEQSLPMNRTRNLHELVVDLVYASTGVWYLYALAVYFLVVKALRRYPPWLLVGGAAVLAVVAGYLPIEQVNRASVLQHLVYFAVGACFPEVVRRIAAEPRRHTLAVLAAGYLVLLQVVAWLGLDRALAVPALSLVAVPLGIRLAVAVTSRPLSAAVLGHLGRRTLPVYVLHMPVLAVLHTLVSARLTGSPGSGLVVAAYPLLAVALVVAGSLLVHRLLDRVGLGLLFRRPVPASADGAAVTVVSRA